MFGDRLLRFALKYCRANQRSVFEAINRPAVTAKVDGIFFEQIFDDGIPLDETETKFIQDAQAQVLIGAE